MLTSLADVRIATKLLSRPGTQHQSHPRSALQSCSHSSRTLTDDTSQHPRTALRLQYRNHICVVTDSGDVAKNPIDVHYDRLDCSITLLDKAVSSCVAAWSRCTVTRLLHHRSINQSNVHE